MRWLTTLSSLSLVTHTTGMTHLKVMQDGIEFGHEHGNCYSEPGSIRTTMRKRVSYYYNFSFHTWCMTVIMTHFARYFQKQYSLIHSRHILWILVFLSVDWRSHCCLWNTDRILITNITEYSVFVKVCRSLCTWTAGEHLPKRPLLSPTLTHGCAVVWGTALQAGRSRVRFPMVSLEFFIDIILPSALWHWGWLNL